MGLWSRSDGLLQRCGAVEVLKFRVEVQVEVQMAPLVEFALVEFGHLPGQVTARWDDLTLLIVN